MESGCTEQNLSNIHNVARQCRKRDMEEDGTPSADAFLLRAEKNELYLSTNWLEYFDPNDRQTQISSVIQSLQRKGRTVKRSESFSVINVGEATIQCKRQYKLTIFFRNLNELNDPSHSGIYGYTKHNAKVALLLARLVSPSDVYLAHNFLS